METDFKFLDSFRGVCAFTVLIAHADWKRSNTSIIMRFFSLQSQTFAISGFFILSSFLLTYRFYLDLTDLDKIQSKFEYCIKTLVKILKYFIRRIFRIYLPFLIYCTLIKFGPKFLGGIANYDPDLNFSSWTSLVTLNDPGTNHLWTISPEIKYYFLVPVFTLAVYLSHKYLKFIIILVLSVIFHSNLFINLFGLKSGDVNVLQSNDKVFKLSLPIFFFGSLLAFVIIYLKEINYSFGKTILWKIIINILNLFLGILAVLTSIYYTKNVSNIEVYNFMIRPAYLWMLVLFMMLISKDNTNLFKYYLLEKNLLLCYIGKYSFGIYLFHPMCILLSNYIQDNYSLINNFLPRVIIIFLASFLIGLMFFFIVEKNLLKFSFKICEYIQRKTDEFFIKSNEIFEV